MKYFSTRGGDIELSFEETVLTGLAPDGGLYIPSHIPTLPKNWQQDWYSYSFQQLSVAVLSLFISPSEISPEVLKGLVEKSYKNFRHPDVTPLKRLQGGGDKYILELWHGPTYAFKDVALQLLGNLFEFFLHRRNVKKRDGEPRERLTVLGATSGDTGSAAIYGLRDKADIAIYILHPKGRVSPIQEAQMTTVTDQNVHNVAMNGTFDDCQDIVKTLFSNKTFNARHRLGAINSINWARILAQTVYYFLAYFALRPDPATPASPLIQFVVPTGNFGDVLAGYYAKRMGLPVGQFVIATNENDILARFWKSGRYEKVASLEPGSGEAAPVFGSSNGKQVPSMGGVKETLSPAMDILVSSNFERLLWYLAFETEGADRRKACETLSGWMVKVKRDGKVEVPVAILEAARRDFVAERISDEQTLETIRKTYVESKYIADPHTAVGIAAAKIAVQNKWENDLIQQTCSANITQIILSTAHPAKFSEAVTRALTDVGGFNFDRDVLPEEFKGLLKKERRVLTVDVPTTEAVQEVIDRNETDRQ